MKAKITRTRTETITLEVEVDVPEGANTQLEIIAIAETIELPTQDQAQLDCLLTGAHLANARCSDFTVNSKATVTFTFEKDLPVPSDGPIPMRRIGPWGDGDCTLSE